MPGYEEYAGLARQLSAQRRDTDRDTAADADRRRALHAAIGQLGQRLTAQGQRLDELGRAIGAAPPGDVTAGAVRTAPAGVEPTAPAGVEPGAPTAPAGVVPSARTGVESTEPAGTVVSPRGFGPAGAPITGGAAAAPGRPEVGAYSWPAPDATDATGTTVGGAADAPGVPAPRAAPVDPAAELTAARQLADAADRHRQQAEALAHRPALLPTWSPPARAAAVYTCCALAGAVLMLAMVVASGLEVVGLGALYAAMCAGLPVASFVAGWLVLGRWGRPVLGGTGAPSRFVPLGFVICVLLVPLVYCAYLLAFRVLR